MYLRWWPPLAVHPLRWREAPPDLPTASFPPQALGHVSQLKKELADKEHQLSVKPTEKAADNELSWLNVLSQETGENVWERINLQKALFELEETNKRNRMELQHLDDAIARPQVNEKDYALFQALTSRRQVILDNICDNDEAGASYRKGMNNVELQIEMESLRSLWNILYGTGLNQKQILKFAAKQGLTVEGCPLPSLSPDVAMPHGRLPPFMSFPSPQSQSSSSPSSCFFQQGFSTMSVLKN
ncbi:Kinesin-like protein KIF19 [Hordeum vulgare]|nr:Kinesin-like protein KIF19 [Hordeum vulgare]